MQAHPLWWEVTYPWKPAKATTHTWCGIKTNPQTVWVPLDCLSWASHEQSFAPGHLVTIRDWQTILEATHTQHSQSSNCKWVRYEDQACHWGQGSSYNGGLWGHKVFLVLDFSCGWKRRKRKWASICVHSLYNYFLSFMKVLGTTAWHSCICCCLRCCALCIVIQGDRQSMGKADT